ncbi:MAG: LPS export ABC transporter permease LptG [Synergistaceae bacterium]|jgi:lipopolysaccharide export system permease protein|nr:LPS export ABC transporter permease LptG [Synergistaceae bacterium]
MTPYKQSFPDRFILDRFILRQMISPFLFGIMSFTVIMVAGNLLFSLADLVIKQGVAISLIARLFLYSLPAVIAMTIPMSCLLAALLGFGSLSSNSELVALKSAGISFGRIVSPLVIAGILLSIFSFVMNETIVPLTTRAAANIMHYEIARRTPPVFRDNVFIRDVSHGQLNRIVYINRIMPRSGEMSDILVQEFAEGHISRIISAPTGNWEAGLWWLRDGQVFEVKQNGMVEMLFKFDRHKLNLDFGPSDVDRDSMDPEEMSLKELYVSMRSAEQRGNNAGRLRMMFYLRIAVPWACVVLVLVGSAVGARPQKSSSGVGLGLSIVIVFCYYVIMSLCKSLGEANFVPGIVAAWIPNAVFLAVGAVLTRRANRLG